MTARRIDVLKIMGLEIAADLSPFFHPYGSRTRNSFDPSWFGDATGPDTEPD
jgi:hypothetical protein